MRKTDDPLVDSAASLYREMLAMEQKVIEMRTELHSRLARMKPEQFREYARVTIDVNRC